MKKLTLIVTSLAILGSTTLFANPNGCEYGMNKERGVQQKEMRTGMYKRGDRGEKFEFLHKVRMLDLSTEQVTAIKKIFKEHRANRVDIYSESFSETTFDKAKFIELSSKKRENMLKSKADFIEKVYNVLTDKQKKELKVLLGLKNKGKRNW